MKIGRNSIILIVILALITTSGIFYYDHQNKAKQKENETSTAEIESIEQLYNETPSKKIEEEQSDEPSIEIVDPITDVDPIVTGEKYSLERTAWIPSWGHSSGVTSLHQNLELFSSISPVWYSPVPDGSLDIKKPSDWQSFISYAQSNDIEVIPSIAMFDAEILTEILNNNSNFSRHINAIMNEAISGSYDGIDIDYEMIYIKDKDRFLTFIEELSKRLHKEGMVLSVTILPQWGDNIIYPSLRETRAVQELTLLEQHADQIRLMTYDYTPSSSPTAGPIGPIDWLENVIKYSVGEIPPEKLWLGIHLYGYEWTSTGGVSATTFSDLTELELIDDFNSIHNYTYNEGTATYSCGVGQTCTLFYQDPVGLQAREDLARKYKLAGVAFWRLGGDGELLNGLLPD